jgi:hypothetical protein
MLLLRQFHLIHLIQSNAGIIDQGETYFMEELL